MRLPRYFLRFFLLALIVQCSVFLRAEQEQGVESESLPSGSETALQDVETEETKTVPAFSVEDIEAAKADLKNVSLQSVAKKYNEMKYPVAYVIGNPKTKERRTFFAFVHNKSITVRRGKGRVRKLALDRLDVIEKDIHLNLTLWNWRNTAYTVMVDAPEGAEEWVVLANLYPMQSTKTEDIYVPYSPKLHETAPDLINAGTVYLDDVYKKAVSILASLPIAWRYRYNDKPPHLSGDLTQKILGNTVISGGGKPLFEVTDDPVLGKFFLKRLVQCIVAIEHIDHDEFRAHDAAWLIEKVLVTVGANRGMAYYAAVSSAGAGGLAQFIKSTYNAVRGSKGYPEAKLTRDFVKGMRDHVNAMVAMILLIDRELAVLTKNPTIAAYLQSSATEEESRLQQEFGFPSVEAMRLWLLATAAYNGGTGPGGEKIARAIRARGAAWFQSSASELDAIRDKMGNTRSQLKRAKSSARKAELQKELNELQKTYNRLRQGTLSPRTGETPIYLQKSLPAYAFFAEE